MAPRASRVSQWGALHPAASPSDEELPFHSIELYAGLSHQLGFTRKVKQDLAASGRMDETFIDHDSYPQSFGATILHVVLHNARHRGEVLHILQRLGIPDLPDGDPQEWEHMTGRIGRVQEA